MFNKIQNEVVSTTSTAIFVPENILWGLGLIIFSLLLSYFLWRQKFGFKLKGIIFWLINLGVFIFSLMKISAAFPKVPAGISLTVLLALILVLAGGTAVAVKKDTKGGSSAGAGSFEKK